MSAPNATVAVAMHGTSATTTRNMMASVDAGERSREPTTAAVLAKDELLGSLVPIQEHLEAESTPTYRPDGAV